MDIVKTRIAELNGTIDVEHAPGDGTTFTIRLPLTLAIIRSLLFRLRHGMFAVPIDNVREIVSVPVDQIVTIHGRQTFDVRGDSFRWSTSTTSSTGTGYRCTDAGSMRTRPATDRRINVVILHSADKTMGLKVDELHGGQDIVIKSLAENFIHIRGSVGGQHSGRRFGLPAARRGGGDRDGGRSAPQSRTASPTAAM